jgi:hypothetical protein
MIGIVAAWMRFEDVRTARLDARLNAEEQARARAGSGEASERAE